MSARFPRVPRGLLLTFQASAHHVAIRSANLSDKILYSWGTTATGVLAGVVGNWPRGRNGEAINEDRRSHSRTLARASDVLSDVRHFP